MEVEQMVYDWETGGYVEKLKACPLFLVEVITPLNVTTECPSYTVTHYALIGSVCLHTKVLAIFKALCYV
jgi:hypothetical protein